MAFAQNMMLLNFVANFFTSEGGPLSVENDSQHKIMIDTDKKIIFINRMGNLDKDSIIDGLRQMHEAENFDPSFATVANYIGVTKVDVGVMDITSLVSGLSKIDKRTGPVAIVVGGDDGRLVLAKYFCEVTRVFKKIPHKAFIDADEALAWISDNMKN